MMEIPTKIPNLLEFLSHEREYTELLNQPEFWRSIPLINYNAIHELEDLSMVRFRGMIQDMHDPEIFLEQYRVVLKTPDGSSRFQNGKYRDLLVLQPNESVDFDCSENVQSERRTMFAVSLPGINQWAFEFEQSNCRKQNNSISACKESQSESKRSAEEGNDYEMADANDVDHYISGNKRRCTEEKMSPSASVGSTSLSSTYLLNSPIPDRPSKACMIKFYSEFESFTLNTIVDVVGFLSVNPALDSSQVGCGYEEFESSEAQAQNPPPSLIPRLHAVAVKNLTHNNPLLDPLISEVTSSNLSFETIYKDMKIILTQCLLGDDLAAEYLLAHLISTVYIRSDLHTIGKFSLNICNLPQGVLPNYTRQLYDILELFLPVSHYLPMTLETMNTLQFFPKKDYETNKLTSGILQLAPHTHLVLDETRLQPGKLESNGVFGVQNLAHLITSQQIKCNFQFYEIDFDVNVPVLVLSEGRSMLPNDFLVPLNADQDCVGLFDETLKAARHYIQPKLDLIRRYLTSAKTCNFSMNPDDSEMIQTDFVEMRKSNNQIGANELHSLLVLSRLLAIAKGKSELDRESWNQALNMEALRKARIEKMPKSKRSL